MGGAAPNAAQHQATSPPRNLDKIHAPLFLDMHIGP